MLLLVVLLLPFGSATFAADGEPSWTALFEDLGRKDESSWLVAVVVALAEIGSFSEALILFQFSRHKYIPKRIEQAVQKRRRGGWLSSNNSTADNGRNKQILSSTDLAAINHDTMLDMKLIVSNANSSIA